MKKDNIYSAPECEVILIKYQQVLCLSFSDNEEADPYGPVY